MTTDQTPRAEIIGSLLHPQELQAARKELLAGRLSPSDFKVIEDRAVDEALQLQKDAGVDVVSDGEMRRMFFAATFSQGIEGLSETPSWEMHWMGDNDEVEFTLPFAVTGKLRRRRSLAAEEFSYLRGRADVPVKVTLPSPFMMLYWWSRGSSPEAYPDPWDMFLDAASIVREELLELKELGCTYVQIDAPEIAIIGVDEAYREQFVSLTGLPAERILDEAADVLDGMVADSGMNIGIHLCRGNNSGRWTASGSYDRIVGRVLGRLSNFDTILLEYDDDRAGSFEVLGDLTPDKTLVLGLVSTKREDLESADELKARIEEASRFYPLERLAISTQCGFASNEAGNPVSAAVQRQKLELVAQVGHEVWN